MKEMTDDGIESISKVVKYGRIRYEIVLKPNYSFESYGGQVMYCDSEKDIDELKKEIVFCDGNIMRKLWEERD